MSSAVISALLANESETSSSRRLTRKSSKLVLVVSHLGDRLFVWFQTHLQQADVLTKRLCESTEDTARALTPTTRSAGRSSGTSASGCSASRSGDGRARHGGVPPRTRRGLRARADRATEPRRGRSCGPRRSYRSQRANADPVRDPRLDGRLGARGGAGQGVGNRDDRIRVRPLLRRAGR